MNTGTTSTLWSKLVPLPVLAKLAFRMFVELFRFCAAGLQLGEILVNGRINTADWKLGSQYGGLRSSGLSYPIG